MTAEKLRYAIIGDAARRKRSRSLDSRIALRKWERWHRSCSRPSKVSFAFFCPDHLTRASPSRRRLPYFLIGALDGSKIISWGRCVGFPAPRKRGTHAMFQQKNAKPSHYVAVARPEPTFSGTHKGPNVERASYALEWGGYTDRRGSWMYTSFLTVPFFLFLDA
jgi:hypothetical protein